MRKALLLCSLVVGCGASDSPLIEGTDEVGAFDEKADHNGIIYVTPYHDDVGEAGEEETRKFVISAAAYRALFGHDAPGIDFSREWLVFYSAGLEPTEGYRAKIPAMVQNPSGTTLKVVTSLESPGRNCNVADVETKPWAMVRFAKPAQTRLKYFRYVRQDTTTACVAPPECKVDSDCQIVADYCTGCDCRALPSSDSLDACGGPGVRCFADPCLSKRPLCAAGKCVVSTVY